MDITTNELKTMKVKQLRRLIRESVMEIIKEDAAMDKKAQDTAKSSLQTQLQALQKKKSELASTANVSPADKPAHDAEKMAVDKKIAVTTKKLQVVAKPGLSSIELDEMARVPKGFRLSDPNLNTSTYTKTISGTPLSAILDYFKENPGADVKSVQSQFQFVRPQIANGLVKGLLDAGVLTKLTAGGEVVAPVAPGEEAPVQASEPEDLFMGSSENPLSMYFDKEPNDDGTEDFNDSEEPTADELEPAEPTAGSMSDKDYEDWMKYDDLKNRLDATKGNILKAKRSKGGVAGDIGDKSGTELSRLQTLKTSLEDRIDAIVSQSDYLKKRIEKLTGKAYVEPSTEPEDDTDTLNEAYEMRKLQFYAGIIK
jgi:hypothetical protein